ncbi:MAG: N-acetylglucosamine-6-phosphate deacetylase [Galactobacter sp.]
MRIIHSATRSDHLTETGAPRSPGPDWVAVSQGRLVAEGVDDSWLSYVPGEATRGVEGEDARGVEVTDAQGALLTGGWVDGHCHGGRNVAFDEDTDLSPAIAAHTDHGTRTLVASLVTNPLDTEATAAARLAAAVEHSETLAGIHLEGPFLDHGHRGAHAPEHLRPATLSDVQRLHDACAGHLTQITMAPEHDPGLVATKWLVGQGVRVAVGHTSCDYATALAAFDAGASLLTHTFNGMPGLHHRAPGPIGAALDSPHVTLELIADLVHVAPTLIRTLFSAAPGRVGLITDAMSATGSADGRYLLGSLPVVVSDGVARLDEPGGPGSIAGSTLTMDVAVRNVVASGVPLAHAVAAATTTPARALGLPVFPGVGDRLDAFLVMPDGGTRPD